MFNSAHLTCQLSVCSWPSFVCLWWIHIPFHTHSIPIPYPFHTQQLPDLVTPAFATTYVTVVGAATAGGRLGWAIASDTLGRKPTYLLFASAIPIMGGGKG